MPKTNMWDDTVLPARVCHARRAHFREILPGLPLSVACRLKSGRPLRDNLAAERLFYGGFLP
jgi:hypothetical protein